MDAEDLRFFHKTFSENSKISENFIFLHKNGLKDFEKMMVFRRSQDNSDPLKEFMKIRKSLVAIFLTAVSLNSAKAALTCTSIFRDTTQSTSEVANGKMPKNSRFTITRQLRDYAALLHPHFLKSLWSLTSEDIILDGGSGRAIAMMQYLYDREIPAYASNHFLDAPPVENRLASVIAVGYERPPVDRLQDHRMRNKADADSRFTYVEGDFGSFIQKFPHLRGSISQILDVHGILKYSHFQRSLGIYLDLLKVGGKLYFNNPNIKIFKDGQLVSIYQYLMSVGGIKVTLKRAPYSNEYSQENLGKIEIKKTSEIITLSRLDLIKSGWNEELGGEAHYQWP